MSARLARVADALDAAGFATERSHDIRLDVWIKLLGNLSFNPVAALTGYLMNQIVADEDVLGVIRAMMLEGMAVSEHYGYPMPMTPDQRIDIARQLGAARISMLQDLEQRRPLELAAIVGRDRTGRHGADRGADDPPRACAGARARACARNRLGVKATHRLRRCTCSSSGTARARCADCPGPWSGLLGLAAVRLRGVQRRALRPASRGTQDRLERTSSSAASKSSDAGFASSSTTVR